MSAHILLNLLNKLGKRYKKRGLPRFLSLSRNEFNKFLNTEYECKILFYHITLSLLSNLISAEITFEFCHYVRNVVIDAIKFPEIYKPLVVYRFYCMTLSLP